MTAHFTIHAGDTRPITATLEDELGPIDLSAASAVVFTLWAHPEMTSVIEDAPAEVLDAEAGEVRYVWGDDETATPGHYRAVFRAIYDDGTPGQISVPSDRYIVVEILP